MRFLGIVDGEEVEVEIDPGALPEVRAVVGGRSVRVRLTALGAGAWWLTLEDRSVEAAVVPSGDGYTVRVGGDAFQVRLMDRRDRLRASASGHGSRRAEIRAPMPGRVVRILAEAGEAVKADQGLIVLEAMKMQNEMKSPRAGIVGRLNVEEGMTVSAGELLVTLE